MKIQDYGVDIRLASPNSAILKLIYYHGFECGEIHQDPIMRYKVTIDIPPYETHRYDFDNEPDKLTIK